MMLALTPRWVLQGIMSSEKRSRKLKNLIRQRLAAYDKAPIHPSLKDYGQKDNYEWQQYFYVMMRQFHQSVHFLE